MAVILALMISAQVILPLIGAHMVTAQVQLTSDPLGSFEGSGIPGSVSSTGDGQRLVNPSFESGLSPWTQSQSNAANGSAVTTIGPGFSGSTSAQLLVNSGNSSALSLASDSTVSLTNDNSLQPLVFNAATRFRIAVQVEALTGSTGRDFVESVVIMSTSTGGARSVHYVFADRSSPPNNSTTDAYLKPSGFGTIGQWISADRNLPMDAAAVFPDAASIDSIQSITLKVHSQSRPGAQLSDPHIMYWDSANYRVWTSGEPVVYDSNGNGIYDSGETVIGCGYPNSCAVPGNFPLSVDPSLKFVDTDHNGAWSCQTISGSICMAGEPVLADNRDLGNPSGDGILDDGEQLINCSPTLPLCTPTSPPLPGTLLEKVNQAKTQALFDQVEIYTATGGYNWVRNGGFEASLTGWNSNSSFASSVAPVHTGLRSASASITGGGAEMAQSIDSKPQVGPGMSLQASVQVIAMAGTTSSDAVDLWIAVDDSQGNSLSLYFYFRTGTSSIPANRTDAVYFKANSFGTMSQWLNLNTNLLQTIQSAVITNSLSFTAPYTVELVVLEASSSQFKTTTANFDDISLGTAPSQTGSAQSYFYTLDGQDTTYVYQATSIPQGTFSLDIPQGRTVLNVTSPEGFALAPGEYTASVSAGTMRVTVLDSTSFKHQVIGEWKIFTSSKNGIASVFVEDPATHTPEPSVSLNSVVNFASQSKDPFGQPLQNMPANLTLWNSNNVQVGTSWPGNTNLGGWWNVSSVTLPLSGTQAGTYRLQATVLSIYPGVRTFLVNVHYTAIVDMSLSTNQTTAGTVITISGTVTRTDISGPAQGVSVALQYRIAGNTQWQNITTVHTDSLGKYTYDWNPPQGEYQVRAQTTDSQTGITNSTPIHLIVNSPGLPELVLIIIIAVVAGAIVLVAFLILRRRSTMPMQQPR